jgi:hypothetical protein
LTTGSSGHGRQRVKLPHLLWPQRITGPLDLAEKPIREVRRVHQEIGRLRATVLDSVTEGSPNFGHQELRNDPLLRRMVAEFVLAHQRQITRGVMKHYGSQPLDEVVALWTLWALR